jgi:methionyl-tRNA formyltransferase
MFLPKVLDKYLREFADTTAGVNIQSVSQGKRTVFQTARELYRMYGFRYFFWKLRKYLWQKTKGRIVNDWLGSHRHCYTVRAVAEKYGVPVTESTDVNSEEFLAHLREEQVDLIVSISGTQLYKKKLRDQTRHGIVNCHGALLPRYRGLMPSFWTLCKNETEGGVSVHFVDAKLDNGPIVVQKRYRIHPHDTLEDVMTRSKDLAAEAIIECVRLIEAGDPPLLENNSAEATSFSMPTRDDVKQFLASGRRFY